MIFLALSIFFASSLYLVFSFQKRYGIPPLLTIVINYFSAATVGFVTSSKPISPVELIHCEWLPLALILGCCFVFTFNLMGKTTQKLGVNVAAVVSKMSMVVPVVFALVYFKESFTVYKAAGIVIALVAVFLTSVKKDATTQKASFWLPVLLFLGCGLVDLLINYSQVIYGGHIWFDAMPATLFLVAGSTGLIYLLLFERGLLKQVSGVSLLLGISLGVFNYYSLFFLYEALAHSGLEASTLYPLNNVGIVALSVLLARLLFKETISKANFVGLLASVLAICLMMI